MEGVVLVAIIAGVGFWLYKMTGDSRARVEIRVEDGRTWTTRGRISGAVLRDINDICKSAPRAKGVVRVEGAAGEPEVNIEGLPKSVRQQVRNVVLNALR